ncbi:LysM peptidoglycan-binding domain-containing protein [Myroides sp. DF42-4-2]|uniref:LysM peptidoglycan-binding domain-containing protein n=1 Tax=unclassified Myroides TaxID=2642485 RepID=UPI002578987F|nr:LysM peptidoglycan-binding domain-containing protein [Myroides sp. DF42-4-2]MDM1408634.1 LysM peptidoglycan-binding domain-containing protein [Myroides sp. DF42-4-2]
MKKKLVIAATAFIFTSGIAIAQEQNYTNYRVSKGETISKIARENKISVSEILRLNPEAKTGIKEGDFIRVPVSSTQAKTATNTDTAVKNTQQVVDSKRKTHVVQPKETVFGISRLYNVSVQDLYQWNAELERNGLKAGSQLYVSPSATTAATDQSANVTVMLPATKADTPLDKAKVGYKEIEIEPRQTLYSLAVEYQTSVQKIMELNPELSDGLKSGQRLKVPTTGKATASTTTTTTAETKPTTSETSTSVSYQTIVIEPKQTLFSIAKEYNLSVEELVEMNPELRKTGLQIGMELKVGKELTSTSTPVSTTKWDTEPSGTFVDLSASVNRSTAKELVLLLPFNTARLGDNLNERMKTDGFLNMTMDFYLGAKLAIDKAASMGLPLTVKVYDSNETKNSSDVQRLLRGEDFSQTEVIIGPFFQSNVDDAVKALPNSDIVLVSPLSNEKANPSSQLVQTMPYGDVLKQALLDHLINNNSKVTVIVDEKKASTKRFMQRYYPDIKVIDAKELKDIDKTLIAGKNNAFILDSNSIESALLLTDKLKNKTDKFDIQVASFEKSEVFDYSEIKIETLVALHYTFPSVTRDSETSLDTTFARAYKAQNNTMPNRFAIRGYDVTLDVILRMFQRDGFAGSIGMKSTEIENKFVYSKNPEGTVRNKGVYILQYNDDLTVKVVE